jgi:hypothetical protein
MNWLTRSLAAGLLFGLTASATLVVAQVFQSAVQLSQDTRGNFVVDSSGNFYINGNRHLNAQPGNAAQPSIGTCTSATMTANSTDSFGQLTGAAGITSCTVNFGQAFVTAPRCIAGTTTSAATTGPPAATATTTVLTITFAAAYTGGLNWFCNAVS